MAGWRGNCYFIFARPPGGVGLGWVGVNVGVTAQELLHY